MGRPPPPSSTSLRGFRDPRGRLPDRRHAQPPRAPGLTGGHDHHRRRNRDPAFGGDGGPAIAGQLQNPAGVTANADCGFLIADTHNDRVRRVSSAGTITTVAGNGTAGFGGIGGPATAAEMNDLTATALTADGGFLIADMTNNRVLFVDADLRFPRGPQGPAGRAPLAMALTDTRLLER
jgi:hypothetical protein